MTVWVPVGGFRCAPTSAKNVADEAAARRIFLTVEDDVPLTFGSLFAGIGGFDLGFERAGMVCKWQVEIDDYANRVLEKHWPNVRRWRDVRTFPPRSADWSVDVICGGFPCQDISYAGRGAGLEGERSGLFYEAMRIVCDLGPRFIVLENVSALLDRGMGEVLGTLASIGFDAEWECLPSSCFGTYHNRDRVFILAHRTGAGEGLLAQSREEWQAQFQSRRLAAHLACAGRMELNDRFDSEPRMARMVDGVSRAMDEHRGRGLGNSVVPQVAEWIGRRIVTACST